MPANYFIKFTPDVPGESTQTGFEGQIEVLSFSWGVSQAGGFSFGGGGGVAQANVQDLSFSFRQNKSSPKLMEASASGKHFDEVVLTCLRAAGDKAEKYLEITLTDVIISSYQTGGSGDEMPIESVSLNFAQVKQEFFTQNDKGVAESAGTGKWNQLTASTA